MSRYSIIIIISYTEMYIKRQYRILYICILMNIIRLSIFYILMHDTINTTLIMKSIKHVQVLEDQFYKYYKNNSERNHKLMKFSKTIRIPVWLENCPIIIILTTYLQNMYKNLKSPCINHFKDIFLLIRINHS